MTIQGGGITILHLLCSPRMGGSRRALFLLHTGTQVGCFKVSVTAQDVSTADKFPANLTKNEVCFATGSSKGDTMFATVILPKGLNI